MSTFPNEQRFRLEELINDRRIAQSGKAMFEFIADLYPICRSITGDGIRETLRRIQQHVSAVVHEVPTGTKVFDWTVPKEWNIRDAYVKTSTNERVIDFQESNLHVVSYSVSVHKRMPLLELKQHLFSLPEAPDWIPYRTSYYNASWGFCLTDKQLAKLKEDEYEVFIDSDLKDGYLTYGEYYIAGTKPDEVLISCHICHPSLCNDNLSGIAVAVFLAKIMTTLPVTYSYRFIFIPGTIGAITWLCLNEGQLSTIRHGLVLTCLGDAGRSTYKKSRRGDAEIDQATLHVLKHSHQDYEIMNFSPYGYDERQFCSPGFDLPVGCLMRTPYNSFPEYHTSGDNLDFVRPTSLADSLSKCLSVFYVLENNRTYMNLSPKCEPQLGKRGLYRAGGGVGIDELAMLWVLNLSDGRHSLLDIAERSGYQFDFVRRAADLLVQHNLLRDIFSTEADDTASGGAHA